MSSYDTVWVTCPECGDAIDFQSYAGSCLHDHFELNDTPTEILLDLNEQIEDCDNCHTLVRMGIRMTGYIERA